MNQEIHPNLALELRQAGASPSEIPQLLPLAEALGRLGPSVRLAKRPLFPFRRYFMGVGVFAVTMVLATIALLIALPLVASPNPLYKAQKLADLAVTSIYPNYRGALMMKQADHIDALVRTHASTKIVLASIADYRVTAGAYTADSPRYSTLEYCQAKLQQAATQAPSGQRQAITNSLKSISSV
jgi:hypothetical protein